MAKELIADTFNNEVEKFHDKLISYIRGLIFDFKRNHGLDDEEISEIFNIEKDTFTDFMHENWDGYVDSRFLAILFLLSDGNFDFSKVIYKKPNDFPEIIRDYLAKYSLSRHDRNLSELFELLGIEDDEDLEMTINVIKEIIKRKNNGKKEEY